MEHFVKTTYGDVDISLSSVEKTYSNYNQKKSVTVGGTCSPARTLQQDKQLSNRWNEKAWNPRLRWMDGMTEDTRKIGAPNWKTQVQGSAAWRRKLQRPFKG